MTKMNWNKFVEKHSTARAFVTKAEKLPKQRPVFDLNGKKTPTFYALLLEWANKNLCGDWTSQQVDGAIILKVATDEDQTKLLSRFPSPRSAITKATVIAQETIQFGYTASDYGVLAKDLGYKFAN